MQIIEHAQGSPEWIEYRRQHFNASEAAAMLGLDPKLSRQELVRMYAIGNEKEFSQFVLDRIIDPGHAMEAQARPNAESIVDDDLFPCTARMVIDGLALSASFDGITMDEETTWEHKRRNDALVTAVQNGFIPDDKLPQIEQGLLVSGADRCLFMVSDGPADTAVYCWYTSQAPLRARIIAGWRQFAADVAAYQHVEVVEPEKAPPPAELPELMVALVGEVKSSNLATFSQAITARIKAINTDLKTDNDFAVAEVTVKFLNDGEDKLEFVKKQALAQTASIDELFKTIDTLRAEMKAKRLNLEKLVEARKTAIRADIVRGGAEAAVAHHQMLVDRIGKPYLPAIRTDFPGVIKGKRSLQAMHDAVATELARFKIEANAWADKIDANLKILRDLAAGQGHQFPDTAQIVLKDPADLVNLVKARLAENAAEAARKEAETRARIEAELRAKADAEAEAARVAAAVAAAAAAVVPQVSQERPQARTGIVDVSIGQPAPETRPGAPVRSLAHARRDAIRQQIIAILFGLEAEHLASTLDFVKALPQGIAERSPTRKE